MTLHIEPSTTLADLVNTAPQLARELERRQLDYCCGGRQSIDAACAAQGLDTATVIAELATASGHVETPEWAQMSAPALVEHLESTHHQYLWHELPRIAALADKVAAVHGQRHPELAAVRECFTAIRADLEPHLLKEERVLFPMIRELFASATPPAFHCGTLRNPISVMLGEHDRVGELLSSLRNLTDDYTVPADGCDSYRALFAAFAELEADTHLHVHKENNLLFPMVVERENEARAAS